MRKKVEIAGLPVTIVPDEEAEQADYMICMPWETPSPFPDNLKGICCRCGIDVQYRWHAPRKPKRMCLGCWLKMEEAKVNIQTQTSDEEL